MFEFLGLVLTAAALILVQELRKLVMAMVELADSQRALLNLLIGDAPADDDPEPAANDDAPEREAS